MKTTMRFMTWGMSAVALLLSLAACCGSCGRKVRDENRGNAVYYWRTTLNLDSAELKFLADNDIKRIYMRYFDVVGKYERDSKDRECDAVPNATIRFNDTVPSGIEVVPVIFITEQGMEGISEDIPAYAERIFKRVRAMSLSQDYPLKEVQLDCDWTSSNRQKFFNLCHALDSIAEIEGVETSSTIRLHQLRESPPPVDRSVLMVYNTGSFRSISSQNSILSKADVSPYLKGDALQNYRLPLDLAWPAYGWSVCFDSHGAFVKLWNRTDLEGDSCYKALGNGRYEVVQYTAENFNFTKVRVEQPSAQEIMEVKALIDNQLGKNHSTILYHLDSKQLSHYAADEIKNIYRAD